ncbi:alanine racemase [Methylomusa anaerophila]|uniref:Alanine racemase n=2 Tax=Methylomusa anaerophila TaxID=1930071 RepID=A0A348AI87_9FIRM|nr:alanine racemase [Methylomusa anaerophila]
MDGIDMFERPVWAEVDLAAIANNVREIKKLVKPTVKFCAVVKGDGYGHGAVAVARTVLAAGADCLAVAIVSEAVELRRAGFTVPIMVLGFTPAQQAKLVAVNNITQTVYSLEAAQALAAAAAATGKPVKVHIKIDTGMGRIGVMPAEAGSFALAVARLPGIEIEGVFSHFATADSRDKSYAYEQMDKFKAALAAIEQCGIKIPVRHIANSAATLELPSAHFDMVRAGIILYGLWPSAEVARMINLKPAMCLKAQLVQVKSVPAGTSISYGRTYSTPDNRRIATLPIGYADGWTRLLSGKTSVLVRGRRAPLVGTICMDQCMVDVSEIPAALPGDTAILFGSPQLTAAEVAAKIGTISYELVCMVGKRVPRLYIQR